MFYSTEKLLITPDAGLYSFINQGVLTVDGMDDVFEMKSTDVSLVLHCTAFLRVEIQEFL